VKHVDLVGLHLEASSGAPLVLLREQDEPHRMLPIFIGGPEAASIALALSGQEPPRPVTHDLLAALLETLDLRVEHVEVTEVRDGTFVAELAVHGPGGGRRLDSRPSDAIALAVRVHAPLYVSDEVLDEAGAIVAEVPDEALEDEAPDDELIDDEVARFRSFLDELDPGEFGPGEGLDDGPSDS
jgi:uncharacterized protein